jgi:CheY-like chemotaxis protein
MARVLIIDDEKENREALKLALGDANPNWVIVTAANENECNDIIKNQLKKVEIFYIFFTYFLNNTK